jgi:demethylmenaquinone methyltransferase/2-methoxy-6-polyprenyl-1,4-benzoquinol methylase
LVHPYHNTDSGKKEQVEAMFDNIAHRYDFLNHFLSLGIDKRWRKKTIGKLREFSPKKILDLATGTGDLAIASLKLNPDKVIGLDISAGMLEKGKVKIRKKGLEEKISLIQGDSEHIPFDANEFDAITVAFGVRNFEDLKLGLKEMFRVLKPGGIAAILEFSTPERTPMKQLYSFYFRKILPRVGKFFSNDRSAYTYLPESVSEFPDGDKFLGLLEEIGFSCLSEDVLSFGIASIYTGIKETHNNTKDL